MKLEIEVCDHCGRQPKAGLTIVEGKLREQGRADDCFFSDTATLCASCRDRVIRFMERGFTAASKKEKP